MAVTTWKEEFEVRLRVVNWNKLNHAYGKAGDVPDLLLQLLEPERFEGAMYQVWGNLYHQGSRYEATSVAVPFLVELLEHLSQGRAEMVNYLVAIALGDPTSFYPFGFRRGLPKGDDESDDFEDELYERVQASAFPIFLRLSGGEVELKTQKMALWSLGWFPERENESRSVLEESNVSAAHFALEMLDNAKQPMRARSEEEEERDFDEFEERISEIFE